MQLASAMSAAEEPDQKTLASANRRHRFVSLRVNGITPHHSPVLFICRPANITDMMIADEDPALFGGAHRALAFLKPAVDQHGPYPPSSPHPATAPPALPPHTPART